MNPHDSRKWTGVTDTAEPPHGGPRNLPEVMRPELRVLVRASIWLTLSPLALLAAWLVLDAATPDMLVRGHRDLLFGWGLAAGALGISQFVSRSVRFVTPRLLSVGVATALTFALAATYLVAGLAAYRSASIGPPERTFEFSRSCGRHCTQWFHQRADGTTLEGVRYGPPADYGRTCTLARSVTGDHGFVWVKILERSREARGGQLAWPIRRVDCFSDMPLASLPR